MAITELYKFFTIAHLIFSCLTTFLLWDALLLDYPFSFSLFHTPPRLLEAIQPISVGLSMV